jgi:hypothetical protein
MPLRWYAFTRFVTHIKHFYVIYYGTHGVWLLLFLKAYVTSRTQVLVNAHKLWGECGMMIRGLPKQRWFQRAFNSFVESWKERQNKSMSAMLTHAWNKHNNQKWDYTNNLKNNKRIYFRQPINRLSLVWFINRFWGARQCLRLNHTWSNNTANHNITQYTHEKILFFTLAHIW